MVLTLNAEKRAKVGKLGGLRKEGLFPAVFYGHEKDSTPIQMKKADFLKVWKDAGESSVVSLVLPDGSVDTLIHDVDFDPLTHEPRHADFYVFEKGLKIEVEVPIEFDGVSPAVKEKGAVLVKVMHELKVKADPTNIPHEIMVDISALVNIDDQITAGDLKLPAGVELEENPEEVVAIAAEAKEEVEEVAAPVDFSQIEVEKKGKVEEAEGAEGGEEGK